jgi:hypothetical protein
MLDLLMFMKVRGYEPGRAGDRPIVESASDRPRVVALIGEGVPVGMGATPAAAGDTKDQLKLRFE